MAIPYPSAKTDKLTITPKANANGSTDITVSADDGTNETNTTFALNIAPVNDAPTSANVAFTVYAAAQDPSVVFESGDFDFVDGDAGDTFDSIYVTTLQNVGRLALSDVNVTLNQRIADIAEGC